MTRRVHTIIGPARTRELLIVLDPDCGSQIPDAATQMIIGLASIDPALRVNLRAPGGFEKPESTRLHISGDLVGFLPDPLPGFEFRLSSDYPKDAASALLAEHFTLLSSAQFWKGDGLVTDNSVLLDQKYFLYQDYNIRIVPPDELLDFVHTFAVGHSIFWPVTDAAEYLTYDIFYLETHWKLRRYKDWFSKKAAQIEDRALRESLRSFVFNRFPFLLYARDMVRSYQIQRDHCTRRGTLNRFSMAIDYHLNHFYYLIWGLLDHLAVIANFALNLGIQVEECGIRRTSFRKRCKSARPSLVDFLESEKVDEWIKTIEQIRHAAAHRVIPIPAPLYQQTEESTRPRDQIREIVLAQNKDILETARKRSPAWADWMVEAMIDEWILEHSHLVSEGVVPVQVKGQYRFIDPVLNIDYDLGRGFGICDAFIFACFAEQTGQESQEGGAS